METKNEISLKELMDYKKWVKDLVDSGSDKVIPNGSIAHAAIVQSAILDNARANHLPVNMYCGEFSIYQDHTKEVMDQLVSGLKDVPASEHPYLNLLDSLSKFFETDGHMNVILDNSVSGLSNQNLWQYIKIPLEKGQLNIKRLRDKFKLEHFTVAGNMYRSEQSDVTKKAACCFNSPDAETLKAAFDVLSSYSMDVSVK